ncbi:MAG: hypothetical protein Fur0012_08450 [Elusimicrobiota bacterium]
MGLKNQVLKNVEKFIYLLYVSHKMSLGLDARYKIRLVNEFYNEMKKISAKYEKKDIYDSMYYCKRLGYLSFSYSKDEGFMFNFTKKGILKLLKKESLFKARKWEKIKGDSKFMVLFDVPESLHATRDKLRKFLKIMGYEEIQKSVFVAKYDNYQETAFVIKALEADGYVRTGFFWEKEI